MIGGKTSGINELRVYWRLDDYNGVDLHSNRSYHILNIEFSRSGIISPGRYAQALTDISNPAIDWVQISKGMGVPAVAVDSCEALAKELNEALDEPGPHVIEMRI